MSSALYCGLTAVVLVVVSSLQSVRHHSTHRTVNASCLYENQTYSAGDRFKPTPCTYCHCPKHGGRPLCAIQDCAWEPNCLRYDRKTDECCGTCLEYGCHHVDERVYQSGSVVSETECERCVCPEEGGTVVCSPKFTCPVADCVDKVTDPGTCCHRCPNGSNCWLGHQVIQYGHLVTIGCKKCQCPKYDSVARWRRLKGVQAVCNLDDC